MPNLSSFLVKNAAKFLRFSLCILGFSPQATNIKLLRSFFRPNLGYPSFTLKSEIMSTNKPPIWFWIVSILGLMWNAMGVRGYIQTVTQSPAMEKMYNAEQLEAMYNMPAWAASAFAIAVFCGVLGCLALLIRKSWAIPLFVLSLLGVIVQNIYSYFMGNTLELMGNVALIWTAAILAIALFLLWFARLARSKSWIS